VTVIDKAILVAFATKQGSTREGAEAIAATLEALGRAVEVRAARDVGALEAFDAVVLGGPLYLGRWHRDARSFLTRHRRELAAMPVAVFAYGPLSAEPAHHDAARKQLVRALSRVPEVQPVGIGIFAGRIDPAQLRFPFDRMDAVDARDPAALRAWAESLPSLLTRSANGEAVAA
jgi:menaquinone-dependent protoporphyrinogen oxidase